LSRKIGASSPIRSYFGIQDSDGYIWLSDNIQGIVRLDENKSEWKIFDPVAMNLNHNALLPNGETDDLAAARAKSINYIYEDRNKRIWFATSDGHVYTYDKGRKLWNSYNLLEHFPSLGREVPIGSFLHISAIYQDKQGQIMFATTRGLVVFDEAQNRW